MNRKTDTYTRLENGRNDEGFVASSTVGEALSRMAVIMRCTRGRMSKYDAVVHAKYSTSAAKRSSASPMSTSPNCTAYFATKAVGITTMLRFVPSLTSARPTSTENHTDPMPPNGLPNATSRGLSAISPAPNMANPTANSPRHVSDQGFSRNTAGCRYDATATTTENPTPQYVEISRPAGKRKATLGKMYAFSK